MPTVKSCQQTWLVTIQVGEVVIIMTGWVFVIIINKTMVEIMMTNVFIMIAIFMIRIVVMVMIEINLIKIVMTIEIFKFKMT